VASVIAATALAIALGGWLVPAEAGNTPYTYVFDPINVSIGQTLRLSYTNFDRETRHVAVIFEEVGGKTGSPVSERQDAWVAGYDYARFEYTNFSSGVNPLVGPSREIRVVLAVFNANSIERTPYASLQLLANGGTILLADPRPDPVFTIPFPLP
jgi:hypothetical protein